MEEAAVARSLGDSGVIVSVAGVRPSADGGRSRRDSRECRGGRMSNSCAGGSVLRTGWFVVAVGMMCNVNVRSLDIYTASRVVMVDGYLVEIVGWSQRSW